MILLIFLFTYKKENSPAGAVEKSSLFIKAEASSTLMDKKNRYSPQMTIDERTTTSWCEGKKTSGIGETLILTLKKKMTIKKLYIKNGFGMKKYFLLNNRVRGITVNGVTALLRDRPGFQVVSLTRPVTAKKLKITIASVYQGTKWNDTCIAEVSVKAVKEVPQLIFPFRISVMGYNFTLYRGGELKGSGSGMAQCDAPFLRGSWKKKKKNELAITCTYNWNKNCPDMEGTMIKDWKEDTVTYIMVFKNGKWSLR